MKSLMLRRTFLRLAAASPIVLSSYATTAVAERASNIDLEAALRRLVFAVGPWPEDDIDTAESFFQRFWNAVPVSESYVKDAALLRTLSERFPSGTHAAQELNLAELPPDERDLIVDLADGLYSLFEIRAYLGNEPTYGICSTDRSRYVQAPSPR